MAEWERRAHGCIGLRVSELNIYSVLVTALVPSRVGLNGATGLAGGLCDSLVWL